MATSRLTALRSALASQIVAQLSTDGTTGVTVTEYPVLGDQWTREDRVWVGQIEGTQSPYTQGSSGFRQEVLEVDLVVYAPTFGGTSEEQTTGEERAETIFASVENTLRTDITVGSTVYNIELASFVSVPDYIDESGPIGRIEATVVAESHI